MLFSQNLTHKQELYKIVPQFDKIYKNVSFFLKITYLERNCHSWLYFSRPPTCYSKFAMVAVKSFA